MWGGVVLLNLTHHIHSLLNYSWFLLTADDLVWVSKVRTVGLPNQISLLGGIAKRAQRSTLRHDVGDS